MALTRITSGGIAEGVVIKFDKNNSPTAPAIGFEGAGNTGTGIYSPADNELAISTDGQARLTFKSDGKIIAGNGTILGGTNPDFENAENITLYVNQSDKNATDVDDNDGGNLNRPFKTIERALLEAAKRSYKPNPTAISVSTLEVGKAYTIVNAGNTNFVSIGASSNTSGVSFIATAQGTGTGTVVLSNDKFEAFTIMVLPGQYEIDNRPGYDVTTNPLVAGTSATIDAEPFRFNPRNGGVIVPRGTSIVGYDLRKTVIRPKYVPAPFSIDGSITSDGYILYHTMYDGANMVEKNRGYIQEQTKLYLESNNIAGYTGLNAAQKNLCVRDIGYFIDAIVKDLREGGNENTFNNAEYYIDGNGFRKQFLRSDDPDGLTQEVAATVAAFNHAVSIMRFITKSYNDNSISYSEITSGKTINRTTFSAGNGYVSDGDCSAVVNAVATLGAIATGILNNPDDYTREAVTVTLVGGGTATVRLRKTQGVFNQTSIFKVTGGCYFWQMTFKDAVATASKPIYNGASFDSNGIPTFSTTTDSKYSHHRVVAFTYADQRTTDGELDQYYKKIDAWQGRTEASQVRPEEYTIVGDGSKNSTIDTVNSCSPYIFNCSLRSVFGMCGMHTDGSKVAENSFKSMVVAQFTGISLQKDRSVFIQPRDPQGDTNVTPAPNTTTFYNDDDESTPAKPPVFADPDAEYKPECRHFHIKASNGGFIQVVSVFAVGYADQFLAETGGDMSITNSNSNFGQISLRAKGSQFNSFAPASQGRITAVVPPKGITPTLTDVSFYNINASPTWAQAQANSEELTATVESVLVGFTNSRYFNLYLETGATNEDTIPELIVTTTNKDTGATVTRRFLSYGTSNQYSLFRDYYQVSGIAPEESRYINLELESSTGGEPSKFKAKVKLFDSNNFPADVEPTQRNQERVGYFWDNSGGVYLKLDYTDPETKKFLIDFIFAYNEEKSFDFVTKFNPGDGTATTALEEVTRKILRYKTGFPSTLTIKKYLDTRTSAPGELLWKIEYTIPKYLASNVIPKPPEKRFIIKGTRAGNGEDGIPYSDYRFMVWDVQEVTSWEKDVRDGVYYLTVVRCDVNKFADSSTNSPALIERRPTGIDAPGTGTLTTSFSSKFIEEVNNFDKDTKLFTNINYLYPSVNEEGPDYDTRRVWNFPQADSRVLVENIGQGNRIKDISVPNFKSYRGSDPTTPFKDVPSLYSVTAESVHRLVQALDLRYINSSNAMATSGGGPDNSGRVFIAPVAPWDTRNSQASLGYTSNSTSYNVYSSSIRFGRGPSGTIITEASKIAEYNNFGVNLDAADRRIIVTSPGYVVNSNTLQASNSSSNPTGLTYAPLLPLYRPSILRASSHTWEYIGLGSGNYSTGFPNLQTRVLKIYEQFIAQGYENSGGFIASSGTNSAGDFYIGNQIIQAGGTSTVTLNVPKLRKSSESNYLDIDNIENRISNAVVNVTNTDDGTGANANQTALKELSNFFNIAKLTVSDKANINNLIIGERLFIDRAEINNSAFFPEGNTNAYGFVKAAKPEKTGFISTDTNDKLYVSPKYLDAWRVKRQLISAQAVTLDNNRVYVQPYLQNSIDSYKSVNGKKVANAITFTNTVVNDVNWSTNSVIKLAFTESSGIPSFGKIDIEMNLVGLAVTDFYIDYIDGSEKKIYFNPVINIPLQYQEIDYTDNTAIISNYQNGIPLPTYLRSYCGNGTYTSIIKNYPSIIATGGDFGINASEGDIKYLTAKLAANFTNNSDINPLNRATYKDLQITMTADEYEQWPDRGCVSLREAPKGGTYEIATFAYYKTGHNGTNTATFKLTKNIGEGTNTAGTTAQFRTDYDNLYPGIESKNVFFFGCSTQVYSSDRWASESPFIPPLDPTKGVVEEVNIEDAILYNSAEKSLPVAIALDQDWFDKNLPNPYSSKALGVNIQERRAVKKFSSLFSFSQAKQWAENSGFGSDDELELLMKPGYYKLDGTQFPCSVKINGTGVADSSVFAGKERTRTSAGRMGGYLEDTVRRGDSIYLYRSPEFRPQYGTGNDAMYVNVGGGLGANGSFNVNNVHFLGLSEAITKSEIPDSIYTSDPVLQNARRIVRRAYYIKGKIKSTPSLNTINSTGVDGAIEVIADILTYTGVSGTVSGGSGLNATFNVTANSGSYAVTVNNGGTGYAGTSQTVTIPGTSLGGTSPANNLSFTVAVSNGVLTTTSNVSGTPRSGVKSFIVPSINSTDIVNDLVSDSNYYELNSATMSNSRYLVIVLRQSDFTADQFDRMRKYIIPGTTMYWLAENGTVIRLSAENTIEQLSKSTKVLSVRRKNAGLNTEELHVLVSVYRTAGGNNGNNSLYTNPVEDLDLEGYTSGKRKLVFLNEDGAEFTTLAYNWALETRRQFLPKGFMHEGGYQPAIIKTVVSGGASGTKTITLNNVETVLTGDKIVALDSAGNNLIPVGTRVDTIVGNVITLTDNITTSIPAGSFVSFTQFNVFGDEITKYDIPEIYGIIRGSEEGYISLVIDRNPNYEVDNTIQPYPYGAGSFSEYPTQLIQLKSTPTSTTTNYGAAEDVAIATNRKKALPLRRNGFTETRYLVLDIAPREFGAVPSANAGNPTAAAAIDAFIENAGLSKTILTQFANYDNTTLQFGGGIGKGFVRPNITFNNINIAADAPFTVGNNLIQTAINEALSNAGSLANTRSYNNRLVATLVSTGGTSSNVALYAEINNSTGAITSVLAYRPNSTLPVTINGTFRIQINDGRGFILSPTGRTVSLSDNQLSADDFKIVAKQNLLSAISTTPDTTGGGSSPYLDYVGKKTSGFGAGVDDDALTARGKKIFLAWPYAYRALRRRFPSAGFPVNGNYQSSLITVDAIPGSGFTLNLTGVTIGAQSPASEAANTFGGGYRGGLIKCRGAKLTLNGTRFRGNLSLDWTGLFSGNSSRVGGSFIAGHSIEMFQMEDQNEFTQMGGTLPAYAIATSPQDEEFRTLSEYNPQSNIYLEPSKDPYGRLSDGDARTFPINTLQAIRRFNQSKTTTSAIVSGNAYTVISLGNSPNFTSFGGTNTVGSTFVATSSGTANGTVALAVIPWAGQTPIPAGGLLTKVALNERYQTPNKIYYDAPTGTPTGNYIPTASGNSSAVLLRWNDGTTTITTNSQLSMPTSVVSYAQLEPKTLSFFYANNDAGEDIIRNIFVGKNASKFVKFDNLETTYATATKVITTGDTFFINSSTGAVTKAGAGQSGDYKFVKITYSGSFAALSKANSTKIDINVNYLSSIRYNYVATATSRYQKTIVGTNSRLILAQDDNVIRYSEPANLAISNIDSPFSVLNASRSTIYTLKNVTRPSATSGKVVLSTNSSGRLTSLDIISIGSGHVKNDVFKIYNGSTEISNAFTMTVRDNYNEELLELFENGEFKVILPSNCFILNSIENPTIVSNLKSQLLKAKSIFKPGGYILYNNIYYKIAVNNPATNSPYLGVYRYITETNTSDIRADIVVMLEDAEYAPTYPANTRFDVFDYDNILDYWPTSGRIVIGNRETCDFTKAGNSSDPKGYELRLTRSMTKYWPHYIRDWEGLDPNNASDATVTVDTVVPTTITLADPVDVTCYGIKRINATGSANIESVSYGGSATYVTPTGIVANQLARVSVSSTTDAQGLLADFEKLSIGQTVTIPYRDISKPDINGRAATNWNNIRIVVGDPQNTAATNISSNREGDRRISGSISYRTTGSKAVFYKHTYNIHANNTHDTSIYQYINPLVSANVSSSRDSSVEQLHPAGFRRWAYLGVRTESDANAGQKAVTISSAFVRSMQRISSAATFTATFTDINNTTDPFEKLMTVSVQPSFGAITKGQPLYSDAGYTTLIGYVVGMDGDVRSLDDGSYEDAPAGNLSGNGGIGTYRVLLAETAPTLTAGMTIYGQKNSTDYLYYAPNNCCWTNTVDYKVVNSDNTTIVYFNTNLIDPDGGRSSGDNPPGDGSASTLSIPAGSNITFYYSGYYDNSVILTLDKPLIAAIPEGTVFNIAPTPDYGYNNDYGHPGKGENNSFLFKSRILDLEQDSVNGKINVYLADPFPTANWQRNSAGTLITDSTTTSAVKTYGMMYINHGGWTYPKTGGSAFRANNVKLAAANVSDSVFCNEIYLPNRSRRVRAGDLLSYTWEDIYRIQAVTDLTCTITASTTSKEITLSSTTDAKFAQQTILPGYIIYAADGTELGTVSSVDATKIYLVENSKTTLNTPVATTSVVSGTAYVITGAGSNFTTFGAPNNTIGTTFVATSSGTANGNVTPSWRYTSTGRTYTYSSQIFTVGAVSTESSSEYFGYSKCTISANNTHILHNGYRDSHKPNWYTIQDVFVSHRLGNFTFDGPIARKFVYSDTGVKLTFGEYRIWYENYNNYIKANENSTGQAMSGRQGWVGNFGLSASGQRTIGIQLNGASSLQRGRQYNSSIWLTAVPVHAKWEISSSYAPYMLQCNVGSTIESNYAPTTLTNYDGAGTFTFSVLNHTTLSTGSIYASHNTGDYASYGGESYDTKQYQFISTNTRLRYSLQNGTVSNSGSVAGGGTSRLAEQFAVNNVINYKPSLSTTFARQTQTLAITLTQNSSTVSGTGIENTLLPGDVLYSSTTPSPNTFVGVVRSKGNANQVILSQAYTGTTTTISSWSYISPRVMHSTTAGAGTVAGQSLVFSGDSETTVTPANVGTLGYNVIGNTKPGFNRYNIRFNIDRRVYNQSTLINTFNNLKPVESFDVANRVIDIKFGDLATYVSPLFNVEVTRFNPKTHVETSISVVGEPLHI